MKNSLDAVWRMGEKKEIGIRRKVKWLLQK